MARVLHLLVCIIAIRAATSQSHYDEYYEQQRHVRQADIDEIQHSLTKRSDDQPEIPDSCKDSNLCEEAINYPQDEVDQLITRLGTAVRFEIDKIPTESRDGSPDENIELCDSEEKIVFPKLAQGTDGVWQKVVNSDVKPVQGVKVEKCLHDNGSVASVAVFQQGYEARCTQKFALRTVTAFRKTDAGLEVLDQEIKVPSCCAAVAKQVKS